MTLRAQAWPRHQCPHPTCGVMIATVQLACRSHWSTIPQALRGTLWVMYQHSDTREQAVADTVAYFMSRLAA